MAGPSVPRPGQRFNRLVAIEPVEKRHGQWYWRFRCDCGGEKVCYGQNVIRGLTTSCGCYHKERMRAVGLASARHGHARHTGAETPTYKSWLAMRRRCVDPKKPGYAGQGVTVCERWRDSFEAFLEDMGERPSRAYSIDRIDNSKGYEPSNCRWATRSQQQRNKRNNVVLTFNGETMTLMDWVERTGLAEGTITSRIKAGWPVEKVLGQPARQYRTSA